MSTTQNTIRALTEQEAASYIGFSRSFLRQSRMNGDRENRTPGPKWIKCGNRSIRYLIDDLDHWLEQFRQSPVNAPFSHNFGEA